MIRNAAVINSIKKFIYGRSEKYKFNGNGLLFKTGSRPIRRKYRDSANSVVRNDVLQIEYFEKEFGPSDVLWDIGSHFGQYSLFAASVAGGKNQVFSFEPDADAKKIQLENIKLNDMWEKIRILDCAVSDSNGILRFKSEKGNSNSHLIKDESDEAADVISVPSRSINSLLSELPEPTFVKIDAEGAEIDILQAASDLLQKKSVRFICELHPFIWNKFQVTYDQFEAIIKKFGRKLELLDPNKRVKDLPFYGTVLF